VLIDSMPIRAGVYATRLTKFLSRARERKGTCSAPDRLKDRPPARAFALLIGRSGHEAGSVSPPAGFFIGSLTGGRPLPWRRCPCRRRAGGRFARRGTRASG